MEDNKIHHLQWKINNMKKKEVRLYNVIYFLNLGKKHLKDNPGRPI